MGLVDQYYALPPLETPSLETLTNIRGGLSYASLNLKPERMPLLRLIRANTSLELSTLPSLDVRDRIRWTSRAMADFADCGNQCDAVLTAMHLPFFAAPLVGPDPRVQENIAASLPTFIDQLERDHRYGPLRESDYLDNLRACYKI